MKGRELVGALIRVTGVVLIGFAVIDAVYAGLGQLGFPMPPGHSFERAAIASGLYALIGCCLIAFAPELTRFAYLRDPPEG